MSNSRSAPGGGRRVMFVATIAGVLDHFVAPLAQKLMESGYETIACCAGTCESPAFLRAYQLPPFRRAGPAAVWRAYRQLVEITRHERPSLLHLHTPPALVLGRLAAQMCGLPAVAVVHGTFLEPRTWRTLVFASVEATVARLARQTVVLNDDDRRFYRRMLPTNQLSVAPVGGIGLDMQKLLDAQHAPRRIADPPSIVVLGRLTPEKNLSRVVEAFSLLRRAAPSATLSFVGDALPGEVPWFVPRQPGIGHVRWVDDPLAVLAGADVVLSASRREGFPMSVAEAVALGIPTVAVSNRGTRQLARAGCDGLVIVEDDADDIAAAVESIIRRPIRYDGTEVAARWARSRAIAFHVSVIDRVLAQVN